jgi:hypothetical protein
LDSWLRRYNISLDEMTQLTLLGEAASIPSVCKLPCPGLRQLKMQHIDLQVQHGTPCALLECTSLTGLDMQNCKVQDASAAAAAIAALPELHSLSLAWAGGDLQAPSGSGTCLIQSLQLPSKLTRLDLQSREIECGMLAQLSALVSLEHLRLQSLSSVGVPGGLPSQLVGLTCLAVEFDSMCDTAEQLQHLSSLTALQELSISSLGLTTGHLTGIEALSQLTSLQLTTLSSVLTVKDTSWACKSGLQNLALQGCGLQLDALAGFTSLRGLCLRNVLHMGGVKGLLEALTQLSALTELTLTSAAGQPGQPAAAQCPAELYTALTVSTNLCSLRLALSDKFAPTYLLFAPCVVYANLQEVDLQYGRYSSAVPVGTLQLQHLCGCCPAVESLEIVIWKATPLIALLPLLQLSALTRLGLHKVQESVSTVASFTAHLSGLRQLSLTGLPQLRHPALLQLTALTGLEELDLHAPSTPAACISPARGGCVANRTDVCLRSNVSPILTHWMTWYKARHQGLGQIVRALVHQ